MAFIPAKSSRRGSPRAKAEVRAKIAHTAHQGRRIELFVTEPVVETLRWGIGSRVDADIGVGADAHLLRLTPSHEGVKLLATSNRSGTLRVCIYGDFLRPSICAPIRSLPYHREGSALFIELPEEWLVEAYAPDSQSECA